MHIDAVRTNVLRCECFQGRGPIPAVETAGLRLLERFWRVPSTDDCLESGRRLLQSLVEAWLECSPDFRPAPPSHAETLCSGDRNFIQALPASVATVDRFILHVSLAPRCLPDEMAGHLAGTEEALGPKFNHVSSGSATIGRPS